MAETILDQNQNTIAITRNPAYLNGSSNQPFAVLMVFGDFKREYPQPDFDTAADVANRMGEDYHVNVIIEQGIDPEYDEYWNS